MGDEGQQPNQGNDNSTDPTLLEDHATLAAKITQAIKDGGAPDPIPVLDSSIFFPGGFEFEEHNTPSNLDPIQGAKTGIGRFPLNDDRCYHRPDQSHACQYGVQIEDPELRARIHAILDSMPDSLLSDCRRAGFEDLPYNSPVIHGWRSAPGEPVSDIPRSRVGCGDLRYFMTDAEIGYLAGAEVPSESIPIDPEALRQFRGQYRSADDSRIRPTNDMAAAATAEGILNILRPLDMTLNPDTGCYELPKPVNPEPDKTNP